ncbi:MAG: DUF512 domain-containing protein [Clostridia bacterium]|nr:DUF512 domain-containing protein [Clostridia bacterium]
MAVTVTAVLPKSPAYRKRIHPGDRLLTVNGHEIADVLDYRFYLQETKLLLEMETPKGRRNVTIRKAEEADIGLEFDTYLMDKQHACRNKCVFCFIDQMPPGMRDSLYFKDDDSRLSFLFGNYITLTNLSEHEAQRIMDMHISPINISVHTTNPALRCQMMNNRFAGESLSFIKRFADAGIRMNCQLVLCPGLNDGAELERSMHDLAVYSPLVESIAVVPVGLTKYRDGLAPLRPFTKDEACAVIDAVELFGRQMLAATGRRVVYPADEWYIKAERPMPDEEFYDEMSQLENGVGLVALLRSQFAEALADCEAEEATDAKTALVTGVAAAPFLTEMVNEAAQRFPQLNAQVIAVENHFFGETITVAGLVTGGDVLRQLNGVHYDRILIPEVMLRREGDRFLDDVTPEEIERELHTAVQVVPVDGAALLAALIER